MPRLGRCASCWSSQGAKTGGATSPANSRMNSENTNLELVQLVATRLGALRDDLVFLGGSVASLLLTDPASTRIRPTDDVDLIVNVASLSEYNISLRRRLLSAGFAEDTSEGAPLC